MPPIDFRELFEAHFDYVWHSLRRLGVAAADLEDVAHEVFLRVHARLPEYDPSRPLRAWLFGFAYRVAADHRRLARHRSEVLDGAVEASDPGQGAEERLLAGERRALLARALEAVPMERRAVLVMHDIEELGGPVIAETLGIPVKTVYSRLSLAREELAAAVRRIRRREVTDE